MIANFTEKEWAQLCAAVGEREASLQDQQDDADLRAEATRDLQALERAFQKARQLAPKS